MSAVEPNISFLVAHNNIGKIAILMAMKTMNLSNGWCGLVAFSYVRRFWRWISCVAVENESAAIEVGVIFDEFV